MKRDIKREISRAELGDVPVKENKNTKVLLIAFDCMLVEHFTGRSYTYYTINLQTGRKETIARRANGVPVSSIDTLVIKMRDSQVAGAGIFEAERLSGNGISVKKGKELLLMVFKEVLPFYGYSIRKEQISLALLIFDSIYKCIITLAEGNNGTERIFTYLIPALIAKLGRLNEKRSLSFHANARYIDIVNMPIVIATSCPALQKALVDEYIPELSRILLESEVIRRAIKAVIRKGRDNYVCEYRLRCYLPNEQDNQVKKYLLRMLAPAAKIDLANNNDLTNYVKRKISVPEHCGLRCKFRNTCQYFRFRDEAKSYDIDIQVCNHNFLINDIMRRKENKIPLLPNYQIVIIDEAHMLRKAARTIYGINFSSASLVDLNESIGKMSIRHEVADKKTKSLAKTLVRIGSTLFKQLLEQTENKDKTIGAVIDRFDVKLDSEIARHLCNIRDITLSISDVLPIIPVSPRDDERKTQVLTELKKIRDQAAELMYYDNLSCWIERDKKENRLCSLPTNLGDRLYNDIWKLGIPTILISGSLSVDGNLSYMKRLIGLDNAESFRVNEFVRVHP
ncbi:MAG: hypothetical protein FWE83_07230 [Oscillospiraceae bacterium]|nr:hypothetical protein [Oscillospiraceae bacterium]